MGKFVGEIEGDNLFDCKALTSLSPKALATIGEVYARPPLIFWGIDANPLVLDAMAHGRKLDRTPICSGKSEKESIMFAKKLIFAAAAAVIAAGGVWSPETAKADDDDAAERAALAAATITLQQAIQAAETAAGGKAVEGGVDDENGETYYYKVEIRVSDGTDKEVLVDMKTGKVAKITADD